MTMELLKCCPKCEGCLTPEDALVAEEDVWLHYVKCINCGWRIESGSPTCAGLGILSKLAAHHKGALWT